MTDFPLRVGMIVPRFSPYHGGVETYTAQAAAALAGKGAEVTVVTQVPRGARLPPRENYDGYVIERHHLPLSRSFDVPSLAAARSACQTGRFDVLWVHSYHTPLAWLAAEQAKAPIVFTPHYHGVGHTPLRQALHRAYRPAGRRLMAASRRIVVDTEAEAGLVCRDFPRHVHRDKLTVIPPAVADPVRGRQPYPGESPVVLTVARQEPYKRTDLLIRAVAQLCTRGVPVRLVVVGDGSGMNDYRELAARLGAEHLVIFTGAVAEETLGRWWASASLYATASRQEAYGIGLAEALAAGLPVVASGILAHREVIGRAGAGALAELCEVDTPDVDAASRYADAMVRLLSITDSCKERAARCTLPTAAETVEQLLETLSAARS
ncbi:glycosyltransferase family 4 protein [Mycobacterium sp. NPDC048908]|uniref:glycosyltransferase family 4 protein n=1 Tax=Mycobacterium sp. NPDC048908 TaxID=3364292 RepID=UPI00371169A0